VILELIGSAAGCGATLAAAHVGLWQFQAHIPKIAAYTIGVGIIGFWFSLWSVLADMPVAAVAFWAIAGAGGVTIVTCYWIRTLLEQHETALFRAGATHEQANSATGETT
jgi:hypothetical protein